MKRLLTLLAILVSISTPVLAQEGGYKLFLNGGDKKAMFNLGPTGIWAYGLYSGGRRPKIVANYFIVDRVENGSPAHGIVRKHDIITGVNGTPFPNSLAVRAVRSAMAFAIIEAEAKDGKLKLDIRRGGTPMTATVQLKKIPDYSPTWPFDCKRSNSIMYSACDYLAREQMPEGDVVADDGAIGPLTAGLLFLASGEPRYLQNAVRAAYWTSEKVQEGGLGGCWSMGYAGLLMAEYYHMTGDKNILPGLERIAERIGRGQMPSGGWSHGPYGGTGAGYGEVNCAGMVCYMTLILAKEIGVKVDPKAYKQAKRYVDSFADAVTSPYGDHGYGMSSGYGGKNGKIGGNAVAHFLAGEKTHAMNHAMSAARNLKTVEYGHTGHFFNTMWSPIAASYAPAKDFRFCMDQMGWYFTLARHWRGGLYCSPVGGPKYSHEGGINMTTGGYGLVFAVARRHLRILGAPKGVFTQKLPAELARARDLHQDDKWDAAIAATDAFLKKSGHDKETIRLANELRDKSKYVKEGVKAVYPIIAKLASGGTVWSRPNKASKIIQQMRKLVGDDPELKRLESSLTESYRAVWRHGRNYHTAYRTLRSLNTYSWFIFSTLVPQGYGDFAMPPDSPVWEPLVELDYRSKTKTHKLLQFATGSTAVAPAGWQKIDFDDSKWKQEVKKSRHMPPTTVLIRVPFDLKNPDANALKLFGIRRINGLGAGGKIYLNGECVVEYARGGATAQLLDKACTLLRKGRNVMAIETPLGRQIPGLKLTGIMSLNNFAFEWAHYKDSRRDAEIRKLVAKRGVFGTSFDEAKDTRTMPELLAVFEKKDFFMPENSYARKRYYKLNPSPEAMSKHVDQLFKSKNFGTVFTAIAMVNHGMSKPGGKNFGRLSEEQKAQAVARSKVLNEWAKQYKPQIIKCLSHEHHFVRRWAVATLWKSGADCKEAIPTLLKMCGNVEDECKHARRDAFGVLKSQPLTHKQWMTVMRSGLTDPSSGLRSYAISNSFSAKSEDTVSKALKYLQDEMLEQIFTAPHGMFSKTTRSVMADRAIQRLPKEKLRTLTPRYLEALRRPTGHQLKGCMNILNHLGEEVIPQLKKYVMDEDMTTRYNACQCLHGIVMGYNVTTPEVVNLLKKQLKSVADANIHKKSASAQGMLNRLENRDKLGEWASGKNVGQRYSALRTMDDMASKGRLSDKLTAVLKRELPVLSKTGDRRQRKWTAAAMARHGVVVPETTKK